MKNLLKSLALVAVSALAVVSCQKDELASQNDGEGVFFSLRTGDAGKTYIVVDGKNYKPQWAQGDEIGVLFEGFISGESAPAGKLTNSNPSGDEANFEGTIKDAPASGNLYAFYPSKVAKTYTGQTAGFDILGTQHPTATSFDPAADLLISKPVDFIADETAVVIGNVQFARALAMLKINVYSADFSDIQEQYLSKLTVTAVGDTLAGRPVFDLTKGDAKVIANNKKEESSVSALYDEDIVNVGASITATGNSVFLMVVPGILNKDAKLKFEGETGGYTFSKEVTLPSDITLKPGKCTEINLSLAEVNCEKKQKETRIWADSFDKASPKGGKEQLQPTATGAVGTGVTDALVYTYSTDNTNIRNNTNGHGGGNPFLWISGTNEHLQISNIAVSGETDLKFSCQVKTTQQTADVTLKYKESTVEGWNTADGKISATTSSINTVQSLMFTISEDITSLDLQIVGSAGNLVVDDIVLEKFIDERTTLATPTDVTPAVDSKTSNKINVTWTAVENADSYEVTLATTGEEDVVETSTTNSISFTGLKYSTQYSVKVKAIPSDVTSYKDSEYSEPVNVTTGEKPAVQIDWVKKAVADILPTDEVVLVGNSTNSLNSTATSSSPTRVAVTVSNGKLTSEVSDDMKWNLVGNTTDGFILYANGTTDRYLYCNTTAKSSSNTCIRVGSQSSNIRNLWTIDSNGYMITKDSHTNRYLSVYDNTDWRGYVNTSNGAQKVEFYVKDDPRTALATPEINVTPDNTNKKITVNWAIVPNAADYTVTCTGQEDKTVTLTSCEFTGLAYGDYTVTVQANPAAGSTTHKSSEKASKNVSIVDTTPVINASNPAAVEATETSVEVPYTVTNKVEGTNLTAAITSGDWISNPQVAADKVTFTLVQNTTSEQRTGTVTLSYAGAADKAITITQKGAGQVGYASLEDLVAAGTPTGAKVTVTFSNKPIKSVYMSGDYRNGIYLPVNSDVKNEIEIYCYNVPEEWVVGGFVSGTLKDCVWKEFNSTWELCPSNWNDITYVGPVATPEIALDGANATITCATADATILYEISDTEPASFTHTYSSAVTLEDGQTIWAKATLTGHPDSKVTSKKYTAGGSDYTTKKTVTYAQSTTSAASCTGGTAPTGSSVSFTTTYTSNKNQLTKNNKMTLTLKGYADKKITGLTLSMKSNKSDGAGYLSFTAGSNTLASIGSSSSGVTFDKAAWNGSFTTSYTNVVVSMADATHIVAKGEDLVIVIGATANSLYCQSFTIEYYE